MTALALVLQRQGLSRDPSATTRQQRLEAAYLREILVELTARSPDHYPEPGAGVTRW